MQLEDRIFKDYAQALKAKDKHKADFLSFVRAELKNRAIELKKEKLDDNEALAVLQKQKKRLQDSKEAIIKSDRADLLEAIEKELTIVDDYLPKPLEESELAKIIEEAISEVGASSIKDMGKVMKEVLAKVGARAEPKQVSALVKNKLAG
ncbi:MAG: GatB/YqeY domain-containing protein [Candidatus Omnitrophota bacterium]|nr:MAG: GatB/YqeY domain-containing protein [Candidatus Omnitrophota bacterium]